MGIEVVCRRVRLTMIRCLLADQPQRITREMRRSQLSDRDCMWDMNAQIEATLFSTGK
jgi:hypothetical protein